MKTLGLKISEYRKRREMTQDDLAYRLNVTPQAVSKWENDLSIPDLPILIELSKLFQVTLDELIIQEERNMPVIVEKELRKNINQMFLRVTVDSSTGDRVRVNLPLSLLKVAIDLGTGIPQIVENEVMKEIDFKAIWDLVESGMIGKIVEVDSATGDHVEVFVE